MKALLNIIRDRLKADSSLSYLRWVEVLDDEDILPDGFDFPGVALKDRGLNPTAQYLHGSLNEIDEELTARVFPCVILLRGLGAGVMGDASLGNPGKGVLDIGADLRTSLRFDSHVAASAYKTSLQNAGYLGLKKPIESPSLTLVSPDGDRLVQRQFYDYTYLRRRAES